MSKSRQLLELESVQRISRIPVVETSVHIASGLYGKIKRSNSLINWYLDKVVEGGVSFVIDTSLSVVPLLELPISVADSIVCKGLDTVQQKVPAINLPPEKILNRTKDYVAHNIVQPVLKRAESAKELAVHGAAKYGEMAASRIDTALDVADQYVEKYLPDATDTVDGPEIHNGESKTIQTIEHVNRLSRKLQRRLTKRTIAEARALRRQGADAAQILLKLAELMVKDPKQFAAKMKALWEHLSEDEPENQVPPANLEQLIALVTRETARRFVHLTNYTVKKASQLPAYTKETIQTLAHHANVLLDQVLKTVHLEGLKSAAISRAQSQVHALNITLRDIQVLIENLLSGLFSSQRHTGRRAPEMIPIHPLSPVAQSPERTPAQEKPEPSQPNRINHQNHQSPAEEKKQEKAQKGSGRKQRKSRGESPPNNIHQQQKTSDFNSNRQNGDIAPEEISTVH